MDNIFSTSWRKASDRVDPARYVGNDIGVRERGGGESRNGMRYPSRKTDNTEKYAPIVCQCLQCTDRQPPTRNGGETRSGGLFPGAFSFTPRAAGAAGAPRKGRLAFETPLLPTPLGRGRGGHCRSLLLQPWNHR